MTETIKSRRFKGDGGWKDTYQTEDRDISEGLSWLKVEVEG